MAQLHSSSEQQAYHRPAENGKHQFVLFAWPGDSIKYFDLVPGGRAAVKETISAIAEAVARFEPVKLLVEEADLEAARARFSGSNVKNTHTIDICTVSTGCPDIWMRDLAPTFTVSDAGKLHGVDFNFNNWGDRIHSEASRQLARSLLAALDIPRVPSSIVTEGGAIEIDGQGTMLASESSILNENRNPGRTQAQVEAELSRNLGVRKFIWVPGRNGVDSTDFHIDAVARFVRPGVILCSQPRDVPAGKSKAEDEWIEAHREVRRILAAATDAQGRPLEVVEVLEPRITEQCQLQGVAQEAPDGSRAVFSYANYLLVDGGVILSQFGDVEADAAALDTVSRLFSEREVVPINARWLGIFGGGIHCVSQEVPLV
ncbi:peptidylarginine deiminase-like enzyme [Cordyceps fumosorosea ARSEF 2679]|uniref:Peptidylarginine deiminase-like enzyme n=1 Tax=Cordyceps fumosorosea (strain ARSEF 2679) TaxID=1081104 RepID=A0A167WNU1_CORFA|nr:peptidylarginine deiminase-like enzyme [Cordyceps fumosorosea ARSEF 2679]OAA64025.1 peptidylarginine deiminase-like enzyme [Cordyceps fumosorosea ARSEF 2679]